MTSTQARSTQAHLDAASAILDRLDAISARRWQRSFELALQAGMGAWAVKFRSLEIGKDGQPARVEVDAPSASVPFLSYRVVVFFDQQRVTCTCLAAQYGRPCKHVGAGLAYAREVLRAYREAASEYAAAMRYDWR